MLSLVLLAAFAAYTWLVVSWGPFVQLDDDLNRNFHVHPWWPVLHVLDRLGQRAICLPVLATVAAFTGWRRRSWRPAAVGLLGVFTVNLVVLLAKLALSRGRPITGESFFTDGDLYPSGHTANVALVYGLCCDLLVRYGRAGRTARRLSQAALWLISLVMFATSLLLRWHWFSDLVGGFLIGGTVLTFTVGIDMALHARTRALVVVPVAADRRERPTAGLIGRFEAP
jgi:membrane-associated phospholipid phosphatase